MHHIGQTSGGVEGVPFFTTLCAVAAGLSFDKGGKRGNVLFAPRIHSFLLDPISEDSGSDLNAGLGVGEEEGIARQKGKMEP